MGLFQKFVVPELLVAGFQVPPYLRVSGLYKFPLRFPGTLVRNCTDCQKLLAVWLGWLLLKQLHVQPLCHTRIPSLALRCASLLTAHAFGPPISCHLLQPLRRFIADRSCKIDGTICSRVLPGCEQSNDRAEKYAIIFSPSVVTVVHCTQIASMPLKHLISDALLATILPPTTDEACRCVGRVSFLVLVERPEQSVTILMVKAHVS